jgi:hypothetical protein
LIFKKQAKLVRFITWCTEVVAGSIRPASSEINDALSGVNDLLHVSTAWGTGKELVANATSARATAIEISDIMHQFTVLAVEAYKNNTPNNLKDLKTAITRMQDEMLDGSAAEGIELEKLFDKIVGSVPSLDSAAQMLSVAYRYGLKMSDELQMVMMNLSPENDVYGEFDVVKNTVAAKYTLIEKSSRIEFRAGAVTRGHLIRTGPGSWSGLAAGEVSVGRHLYAKLAANLEVVITVSNMGVGSVIDAANVSRANNVAVDADLIALADALATPVGAGSAFRLIARDYYGTAGAFDRVVKSIYRITLPADTSVLAVPIGPAGAVFAAECTQIDVDVTSVNLVGYGPAISAAITGQTDMKVSIGTLPSFLIADQKQNDRVLSFIGAFDNWIEAGNVADGQGRSTREVLNDYALSKLGLGTVAVPFFAAGTPLYTVEFWLGGNGGAAPLTTLDNWRKLYRQWYRMVPFFMSSALGDSRFMLKYGETQVGLLV